MSDIGTTWIIEQYETVCDQLVEQESSLRRQYRQARPTPPGLAPQVTLSQYLQDSVRLIEEMMGVFALTEATVTVGAKTMRDAQAQEARIATLATTLSGLNLNVVLAPLAQQHVPPEVRSVVEDLDPSTVLEWLVEDMTGSVRAFPIERLEHLALGLEQPALGHRCRIAYERLVAGLRRHTERESPAVRALGPAYVEGRLQIGEIAEALEISVPDTVAELERLGFARAIETTGLDGELGKKLEAIRADRQRRAGRVASSQERTSREVIASQRIESVDARPWLMNR